MSTVVVRNRLANSPAVAPWQTFNDPLPSAVGTMPWIERVNDDVLVSTNAVVVAMRGHMANRSRNLLDGYVPAGDTTPEITDAIARSADEWADG